MYKYCICILYCYFTRFPDGQRREKQRGGKKGGEREACPILHTVETSGGRREERRGAVPGFVHREEHFVSDQPQSDWKEETVTGRRESRGLRED